MLINYKHRYDRIEHHMKTLFCAAQGNVLHIQATDFHFLSLDVRWIKMQIQNHFKDIYLRSHVWDRGINEEDLLTG